MLIEKPDFVAFDFDNRWQESLVLLDSDILFASGRAHYPLADPDGKLLIGLLQHKYVRVHAQKYSLTYEATPEEYQMAKHLAALIHKRSAGAVLHALHIYRNHEPLDRRNEYNALFYPALKAYIRFGNLYPAKLLAMLGEEQCDVVALFRDCVDSSTEDRFFIFTLGVPKADYLALMAQEREQRAEDLAQAVTTASARGESMILEPIGYDEGDQI